MICQKCKATAATVCVSQVVDGRKIDIYLCRKCANESAAAKLNAALGFLDGFPGHLVFGADQGLYLKQPGAEKCETCGMTFAEIQKIGKVGCAGCYSTFRTRLRPIITRIHRSAQHRGKRPDGAADAETTADAAVPASAAVPADAAAPAGAEGAADAESLNGSGRRTEPGTRAVGSASTADAAAPAGAGARDGANTETETDGVNRIIALKSALAEAIRLEEYERAAEIRDQIKALERSDDT